ncbi:MAG: acyltransferase family protein [Eubacterium sp.]|nr:acyltransferase family protein [Eubacterium sp.]
MAAESGKRIRFLDVAKGIGILMVTFGHITELDNPVDNYMSLYKITLFYFVSGYLLSYLNRYKETGYGKYFLGVFRHIGIPYVLFSIAAIGVRVFRAYVGMKDVEPVFQEQLMKFVTLRGIATLWFLPTIFFAQIILFIIVKNSDHIIGKAALASVFFWPAAVLIYWNTYTPELGPQSVAAKSLIAVWFMAAGFMYHKALQDHIDPRLRFIIGVLLTGFTFWLSRYSSGIDFNLMNFGEVPWVFFVGGITGSLGLIMVLEGLEHVYVPKLLEYFGINSLIIMCAQRGLLFLNIITAGWGSLFRLTDVVCAEYYIERVCILILLLFMTSGLIELIRGCKESFRGVMQKRAQ